LPLSSSAQTSLRPRQNWKFQVWAEDDKGKRRLLLRDSVILDDESGDLEDTMSDDEVRPCVTQSRTQRLLRSVPFAVASTVKVWTWA
jgi:hypothetical protein